MRTIVLAAGQGFQLDGLNKVLLRDPVDGKRIMDQFVHMFGGTDMTVVVGYKAIEIMQRYPELHYVHNADWKVTNNSYSLGLALNEEPCYVTSCDLFMDADIVDRLNAAGPNCMLTARTENRQLNSLNCGLDDDGRVVEIYQGGLHKQTDPEAMGVFKISDRSLLASWRQRCMSHSNLFCGQNLPLENCPVLAVDKGDSRFDEINTVADYIRVLANARD